MESTQKYRQRCNYNKTKNLCTTGYNLLCNTNYFNAIFYKNGLIQGFKIQFPLLFKHTYFSAIFISPTSGHFFKEETHFHKLNEFQP